MSTYQIGDRAYYRKDYHNRTEWRKIIIGPSYKWIADQFPEDFRPAGADSPELLTE